jgi:hypothetical protein
MKKGWPLEDEPPPFREVRREAKRLLGMKLAPMGKVAWRRMFQEALTGPRLGCSRTDQLGCLQHSEFFHLEKRNLHKQSLRPPILRPAEPARRLKLRPAPRRHPRRSAPRSQARSRHRTVEVRARPISSSGLYP